jgi:hypothetical protein
MYINGCTTFQITIKYSNIFHSKVLQNVPKFGFLVRNYETIWQSSCSRHFVASETFEQEKFGSIFLPRNFSKASSAKINRGTNPVSVSPGTDVMIFKMFSAKNLAKNFVVFCSNSCYIWQTLDHNIAF